MGSNDEVLAAEDRFFQALLQSDPASLTGVLTPDFLLIDVTTGSEIPDPSRGHRPNPDAGPLRRAGVRSAQPV